jgi:uncharacterized protein (DUF1697 family)
MIGAMTTWVALLRAVNLGPTNKVAMADLRALLERLGYADVRTLLLSGNAVFTSPARSGAKVESAIERALADDLGLRVKVLARSASELAKVVRETPYADAPPKELHVAFLSAQPGRNDLDPKGYAPDEFTFGDRVAYLRLRNGVSGSRLPSFEKTLGLTATVRTWNTVTKLHALAGG